MRCPQPEQYSVVKEPLRPTAATDDSDASAATTVRTRAVDRESDDSRAQIGEADACATSDGQRVPFTVKIRQWWTLPCLNGHQHRGPGTPVLTLVQMTRADEIVWAVLLLCQPRQMSH